MKKKKEVWTLQKVIDPHSSMPQDINDAFFKVVRDFDYHNGSYHYWTVSEDAENYAADEDLDDESKKDNTKFLLYKKVDDWLLANGLEENETVIIFYWW